jgi:hypothetical protein
MHSLISIIISHEGLVRWFRRRKIDNKVILLCSNKEKVMIGWLTLLRPIQNIYGSKLGQEIGYLSGIQPGVREDILGGT